IMPGLGGSEMCKRDSPQAVGRAARSRGNRRWYTTGPLGLITRPFCR
ncbi:hypothetical protein, partial [Klebsiella pneumoniae]